MGVRKVLIVFACILFVSCGRGNVSAPIVNTIRLEDGELFLLLNNTRPKTFNEIDYIEIDAFPFGESYYKNLKIDEIVNRHGRLDYLLLRTKGLPEKFFAREGHYIIDIECVRLKIKIEVLYKDEAFRVLSEEYSYFPEYHKWEHYKNFF